MRPPLGNRSSLRSDMTLEEFKRIFWFEYAHRMWGRAIGVLFVVPAAVFAANGWLAQLQLGWWSLGVASLIGLQGVLGWYMVKSGLDPALEEQGRVPRVSQYRLAAHLGSAFAIYALCLWRALSLLLLPPPSSSVAVPPHPRLRTLPRMAGATAALVFVTALSGSLVAGLDAGLIYNEFPLMGGRIVPSEALQLRPVVRNFTENPAMVQFQHRYLGMATACAVAALWFAARPVPLWFRARFAVNGMLATAGVQVTLGIATLLYLVPTPLAAAHQAGSLTLLSLALWFAHELNHWRRIARK